MHHLSRAQRLILNTMLLILSSIAIFSCPSRAVEGYVRTQPSFQNGLEALKNSFDSRATGAGLHVAQHSLMDPSETSQTSSETSVDLELTLGGPRSNKREKSMNSNHQELGASIHRMASPQSQLGLLQQRKDTALAWPPNLSISSLEDPQAPYRSDGPHLPRNDATTPWAIRTVIPTGSTVGNLVQTVVKDQVRLGDRPAPLEPLSGTLAPLVAALYDRTSLAQDRATGSDEPFPASRNRLRKGSDQPFEEAGGPSKKTKKDMQVFGENGSLQQSVTGLNAKYGLFWHTSLWNKEVIALHEGWGFLKAKRLPPSAVEELNMLYPEENELRYQLAQGKKRITHTFKFIKFYTHRFYERILQKCFQWSVSCIGPQRRLHDTLDSDQVRKEIGKCALAGGKYEMKLLGLSENFDTTDTSKDAEFIGRGKPTQSSSQYFVPAKEWIEHSIPALLHEIRVLCTAFPMITWEYKCTVQELQMHAWQFCKKFRSNIEALHSEEDNPCVIQWREESAMSITYMQELIESLNSRKQRDMGCVKTQVSARQLLALWLSCINHNLYHEATASSSNLTKKFVAVLNEFYILPRNLYKPP